MTKHYRYLYTSM